MDKNGPASPIIVFKGQTMHLSDKRKCSVQLAEGHAVKPKCKGFFTLSPLLCDFYLLFQCQSITKVQRKRTVLYLLALSGKTGLRLYFVTSAPPHTHCEYIDFLNPSNIPHWFCYND